jgi:activated CDC42 kinase 1
LWEIFSYGFQPWAALTGHQILEAIDEPNYMKPEQLKTVVSCTDVKKDHLMYRQGDIITVLDKLTNSHFWKGVLNSGKTGLFNPANTVAHIDSLPSSMNK